MSKKKKNKKSKKSGKRSHSTSKAKQTGNLADPQPYPIELSPESIITFGDYRVSFDPIENYPGDLQGEIELLKKQIQHAPELAITRLLDLQRSYPTLPVIYNYLSYAYQSKGDRENARLWIKECYRQFPDYLFARVNMALLHLSMNKQEQVEEIFAGKFDLKSLYPEREVFHIGEVTAFYHVVIKLYQAQGHILEAEKITESIVNLAPDNPQIKALQTAVTGSRSLGHGLKGVINELRSLGRIKHLPTNAIVARLKELGVDFDGEEFARATKKFHSAVELLEHWQKVYPISSQAQDLDFIWMAITELRKRQSPNQ